MSPVDLGDDPDGDLDGYDGAMFPIGEQGPEPMAPPMLKLATISSDGLYRYTLTRDWSRTFGATPIKRDLWIMLNPSTADHELDDPTIRRCIGFSRRDEQHGLSVVNLFAWRATKPSALWTSEINGHDIVGPGNDAAIRELAAAHDRVVCAWGAGAAGHRERVWAVVELLRAADVEPLCLGVTGDGHPRHPLYVKGDTPLVPFVWGTP